MITETLDDVPSETLLLHHFRSVGIATEVPAFATGRFKTEESNEVWVEEVLHGLWINGRKTYFCIPR